MYNETIASFANAAGVGSGEQLRASGSKANKPGGGACTCIAFRTGQPDKPALPLSPTHLPAHHRLCTSLTPTLTHRPAVHSCVHDDT